MRPFAWGSKSRSATCITVYIFRPSSPRQGLTDAEYLTLLHTACIYALFSVQLWHRDVHEAIQDAISLVRVPRAALGICCSGRGAVAGRLLLRERPSAPWLDCTALGIDGTSLTMECNA